jgi:hypothetical protein
MHLYIVLDGKEYISKPLPIKKSFDEMAEIIYSDLENYNKFKMELHDGYLFLGEDAIKRCVITLKG